MRPDFTNSEIIFLHSGELVFSRKPMVVTTVLGSCVSITLFSRRRRIAGISHCQFPRCKKPLMHCKKCTDTYKYVDCTIKKMIEKFESLKIDKKEIEVKIFGGGDVLTNINNTYKSASVGKQNAELAVSLIKENRLILSGKDIGGNLGRKIFFLTGTGEVYLKRLKNNEEDQSSNS